MTKKPEFDDREQEFAALENQDEPQVHILVVDDDPQMAFNLSVWKDVSPSLGVAARARRPAARSTFLAGPHSPQPAPLARIFTPSLLLCPYFSENSQFLVLKR